MTENKLVGISKHWFRDIWIGLALGFVFYYLGNLFGVTAVIGIPSVPSSLIEILGSLGTIAVICVLAPIFEEVLFRDFILQFFDIKLFNAPYFLASIISSGLWLFYHILAYGSQLATGGQYISVFIVGMILCYMRLYFVSLMPLITFHSILNFLIANQQYNWIKIA